MEVGIGGGGRGGVVIFMSLLYYMFQNILNTFGFGYIFGGKKLIIFLFAENSAKIIHLIFDSFPNWCLGKCPQFSFESIHQYFSLGVVFIPIFSLPLRPELAKKFLVGGWVCKPVLLSLRVVKKKKFNAELNKILTWS